MDYILLLVNVLPVISQILFFIVIQTKVGFLSVDIQLHNKDFLDHHVEITLYHYEWPGKHIEKSR